jgi:hypothetical protein
MQIVQFHSVFRIRELLIQIRESIPMVYGSGPCSFLKWPPKDANKKISFIFHVFLHISYYLS